MDPVEDFRTLHVITTTARRGAEVFASALAAPLRSRGVGVDLVALVAGWEDSGVHAEVLGDTRLGAKTLAALRARISATHVVVAHGSSTLPAAAIAGLGLNVPLVYRSIGDTRAWTGTWTRRVRVRALLRRPSAVVALWDDAAHALEQRYGLDSDRIRVIPNAVPAGRFRPPSSDERRQARRKLGLSDQPVIAFVGALSQEKDPQAAICTVASIPGAHLLVAGDGPERPRVAAAAQERLPGRASLVGSVDDVREVYWAADVLLLPSRTEGIPAGPIEAGLCGIPTVATTVGAVPQVVLHGKTGMTFEQGDIKAATAGLRRALENRPELGEAARTHCLRQFDLEVVADAWATLLRAVRAGP